MKTSPVPSLLPLALISAAAWPLPAAPAYPGPARSPDSGIRLVVSGEGNEARYRVREQLVRMELPNDAVGVTRRVRGVIQLTTDGQVDSSRSRIDIDAATLTSDSDRRDGYVRRNVLETDEHPTITFVPTAVRGLAMPLPESGRRSLELVGTLTVRGVSRPTTWQVEAEFEGDRITGTATTSFTFEEMELRQPRVRVVLSVSDTIALEYDFALTVEAGRGAR